VKVIAQALKNSKHTVIYTGAGVSTSVKIPDYRGPQGVWTLRNKGTLPEGKELSQALPTYTHYAIRELVQSGLVQYIVSTNLDGLHRRSGLTASEISELHGNCYREICATCSREYLRAFDTLTTREDRWTHLTGRTCECGGPLKDTIVHFTENMPHGAMAAAMKHARTAEVALVLGTSMNVQPAASLPDKALQNPNGKFFIVNLQRTPYDSVATLHVFGKTDQFMELLMKELGKEQFDQEYDHVQVLKQIENDALKKNKHQQQNTLLLSVGAILGFASVVLLLKKR